MFWVSLQLIDIENQAFTYECQGIMTKFVFYIKDKLLNEIYLKIGYDQIM